MEMVSKPIELASAQKKHLRPV